MPGTGMRIVVTGSIASDNLMVFPGRFRDQLVDGRLDEISLSFLVDDLAIHWGGIAPDIAFGLGCFGLRAALVGAVGADFTEYGQWLEEHGVDIRFVRISETRQTARFFCTTDSDHNQIATFYAGAMDEAREIELRPVVDALGGVDLVVISPNDPAAMLRHTQECRQLQYDFAADPSQQLARMDGPAIRTLVEGATYLFCNDYERSLLEQKTGWSSDEVLARVGTWITTRGPKGATIERRGQEPLSVPAALELKKVDPTGVGDAFRAGFLAGVAWKLGEERSAQLGCMLATLTLESVGTQEYAFEPRGFVERFAEAYGDGAAAEVAGLLETVH